MEIYDSAKIKCGFCGEKIPNDIGRCPYCGSLLDITIESPKEDIIFSDPNNQKKLLDEYDNDSQENIIGVEPFLNKQDLRRNDNFCDNTNVNQFINKDKNSIKKGNKTLGNGLKVFLTIICTVIPGLGQLIGIIIGFILMTSEDEESGADKRSFGLSLLVACLVMFVLTGILWFTILLALSTPFNK